MNNRVGLKDMFEHKEALTLLARSMQPNLGEKSNLIHFDPFWTNLIQSDPK